jgi:hypothetical protein
MTEKLFDFDSLHCSKFNMIVEAVGNCLDVKIIWLARSGGAHL